MSDDNTQGTKKSVVIKVVAPLVILALIIGIWYIKNKNDLGSGAVESPGTIESPGTVETYSTDFELHVMGKMDIEKLKSYGLPIIIDFGADSCIPCKQMAPVLKELNSELNGKAIIKFVDVWKYRELAQGYPISLIPTQIFIDATGKPYKPKNPEALQMKQYTSKDNGEHIFTAHEGGITKDQLLSVLSEMGMK